MKIRLSGEDFNRIMRVCVPHLDSPTGPREPLKYIEIQCDGAGNGWATALDGYTLAQTHFNCDGSKGTILIPRHRNVRKDCVVTIEQKDGNVSISDGIETLTRRAITDKYVRHNEIIANAKKHECVTVMAFDRNLLERALRSHKSTDKVITLEFRGEENPCIIRGQSAAGLVLPVRTSGRLDVAKFRGE